MALYLGTVCFGTIVPDLVLEFRWPGTEAPHPDSPVHQARPRFERPGPYQEIVNVQFKKTYSFYK